VIGIKCLDSSAWLAYYFGDSLFVKELVEKGEYTIVTSSLTLFEIKKRLLKLKKDAHPFLSLVKQRGSIIVPATAIAERAAQLAVEKKLGAMDALIYASALATSSELITQDSDFCGLEGVQVID